MDIMRPSEGRVTGSIPVVGTRPSEGRVTGSIPVVGTISIRLEF